MSRFGAQLVDSPTQSRYGALALEEPATAATPGVPSEEPDETVQWAGRTVSKAKIAEVAKRRGTTPEAIMRYGTWGGRFMGRLASTATGQTMLRLQQGLQDLTTAALDLTDRAGLIDIDRDKLQEEQRTQDEFLKLAEQGGDITALLGDTGNRIYSNATRSLGKVAAAGVAGPVAVYSAIGAESWDNNLIEAERHDLTGVDQIVYAGKKTGTELAVMYLMGRVANKYGARTLEESFTPAARKEAARFVEKSGLGSHLVSLAKKSSGAFLEAGEESITDSIQQFIELGEGFRSDISISQILEAGATGALATGIVGSIQGINNTLAQKADQLESFVLGAEDAKNANLRRTREEVEDLIATEDDAEFRKAAKIPVSADAAYVEEYRAQLQDRLSVDIDEADVAGEVTGVDVTPEGVPEPTNKTEALTLAQTTIDATQATEEEFGTTTARHVDLDRDAKILGLDSYYSPGVRAKAIVQAEARKLGIPDMAFSIAQQTIKNKSPLKDVEQEGLKIKFAELKSRSSDIAQRLAAAQDESDIGVLGAELNRVTDDAQVIHDALAISGTQASLSMLNRKTAVADDYTPVSVLARAKSAKRKNTTQQEAAEFNKMSSEHESVQAKLEKADSEVRGKQAEKILQNLPESNQDIADLYKRAQELFRGGCDF
jgi:hypothetical protein